MDAVSFGQSCLGVANFNNKGGLGFSGTDRISEVTTSDAYPSTRASIVCNSIFNLS